MIQCILQGGFGNHLLCYFLGKPIKCISLTSRISNRLQAEDTHVGIVKFRSAICSINLTTALRPNDYESSIEFFFRIESISLILFSLILFSIGLISFDP